MPTLPTAPNWRKFLHLIIDCRARRLSLILDLDALLAARGGAR